MPIRWIPTELDPRKMIASPTLDAVRALLRAHAAMGSRTAQPGARVRVRVEEHPPLSEVGGVARVDDGSRGAVAVARIGRTSFVAYRLDAAGLRQLPVDLDPHDGSLEVRCDTTT